MKNATLLLLSFLTLIGISAPFSSANDRRPVVFRTETMGTWASLTIVTADSTAVSDIAEKALLVFHRVDSLMSNWTDNSDIARINREAGKRATAVHPEVAAVLGFAQRVSRDSGGAFDITVEPLVRLWGFLGGKPRVPQQQQIDAVLARIGSDKVHFDDESQTVRFDNKDVRIDLGGIAKGYAVDRVATALRAAGATNALVDLSGNMIALGSATTHEGWYVGIRDPSGEHAHLARIKIRDRAVATSGDYEQFVDDDGQRYGHILNPRTGWSARGLSSVTVVAGRAMACDAWATALFVLGPVKAREIAQERDDLSVVLVEPHQDGVTMWVEEALRPHFELDPTLKANVTVRYF